MSDTRHHVLAFEEGLGFGGAFIDMVHIGEVLQQHGVRMSYVRSWQGTGWDMPGLAGCDILDHERWYLADRLADRGVTSRWLKMGAYGVDIAANLAPLGVRYARWAKREKVTAIFLNNSLTHNLAGAFAARWLGLPLFAYFQGVERGRLFTRLLPWLTRGFAVSAYIADRLEEIGCPRDRVDVLYPGAFPPSDPELARPRADPSPVRVGMVGLMRPWKGQLAFLEAFAIVAREERDVEAWLFGPTLPGDEGYRAEVDDAIARHGLTDRVRILEDRSSPETIYPEVDLTVHSSVHPEPFGRVIIEAMSFGRPCIAAGDGGTGEIVRDGDTGFLAHPTDPELVAKRVLALVRDRAAREAMGERARAAVAEGFSYPAVVRPVLAQLGLG